MAEAAPAPRRGRLGLGGAFAPVLATLVTALMPVVVGMGYAPWNAEVLLSLAALAAVALLAAAALRRVPLLLHVFACFWVYWALDAYLPESAVTRSLAWAMALTGIDLQPATWQWLLSVAPPVAVLLLLSSKVADNVRAMLLTFAAVWFVGLWWSPDRALLRDDSPGDRRTLPAQAHGDTTLPPLVHIILDEHTSARAQPQSLAADHPARTMVADYLDRGLDVHTHVDAVAGRTHRSLAAMFNFQDGVQPDQLVRSPTPAYRYELRENAYKADLMRQGYRLTVVQNSYLRLCPPDGAARCLTYTAGKTGPIDGDLEAGLVDRLALLLTELDRSFTDHNAYPVRAYPAVRKMLAAAGFGQAYDYAFYSMPVAGLNVLDQLRPQLVGIDRGEAWVVHLLLPHAPFILDANCAVKPYELWSAPLRNRVAPAEQDLPHQTHLDYWDQAACAHRRVMQVIDEVRAAAKAEPQFIIHGDHGARLTSSHAEVDASPAVPNADALRTFVATRSVGSRAGTEHTAPARLPTLFQRVADALDR